MGYFLGGKMTITFYNMTDDKNKLNKSLVNGYVLQNIYFKKSMNENTPYLILQGVDLNNYNYCFISELNKYYFVDSITIENNSNIRVDLKIDVLMTYKTIIEKSHLNIVECEKDFVNNQKADSIKNDLLVLSKIDIDVENLFNGNNLVMVVQK